MSTLTVRAGNLYTGGLHAPWYASISAIKSKLQNAGFAEVLVLPRAQARLPFDPRKLPGYSDDWDTFISARAGTTKTFDLSLTPAWFVETPRGGAPRVVPGVKTGPSSSGGGTALFVLALLYAASRR